tara:strand:- start:554 stop:844 length:291 start_codon:yes stop_codon:yes gene_type:complete
LLFQTINQIVQHQTKQVDINQSFQEANLLILKSINLQSIQEQIENTEDKENAAHDFLIFEKDEIWFFLNRFRVHDLVVGDVAVFVVEDEHAVFLFV